jgi:hypothetical protein
MIQPNGRDNKPSIYRPKALQHYLQAGEQAVLPPIVRPRTFLFLWLLLGLLLAGGSLAWLTQIPIRAAGFAVVTKTESDSPVLVCFMPAKTQLDAGQQVLVRVGTGGEFMETKIQAVNANIISPHVAQTHFGLSDSAATLVMQPSAVFTATLPAVPSQLDADALLGSAYNIEVTTGSRPLISLIPIIGPAFAGER